MTACLATLRNIGILLKTDARWPSVTTLVAGEPVQGSWWKHPAGRAIFRAITELETRLFAHGQQFHIDAGHHAKHLELWTRWRDRIGLCEPDVGVLEAKRTLESLLPGARFPWRG